MWDFDEHISVKFYFNSNIFVKKKAFENAVGKILAILFGP